MYSTTSDMLRFATNMLQKKLILSPYGYEQYFFPGAILSDGVSSYGKAGWEVAYSNGLRIMTKGGLLGGFSTTLVLVPDLKLGLFFWSNVDISTSYVSARATNRIVPLILSKLAQKQPKRPVAPRMNEIVGEYYYKDILAINISSDDQSDITGKYFGTIGDYPVWFEYDNIASNPRTDSVSYLRYHMIPNNGQDSCFILTMEGLDDGLIKFYYIGSKWYAQMYDSPFTADKREN